jgi:hypothetical protein
VVVLWAGLLRPSNASAAPGDCVPQPEICDGQDNDCDGDIDEDDPAGDGGVPLPVCGSSTYCVVYQGVYQCAGPCNVCGFPCSSGQVCGEVQLPGGKGKSALCVSEGCGGGCGDKTVSGAGGVVECGPDGGFDDLLPRCACHGPTLGCRAPCVGVVCAAGQVCNDFGPYAGTCVDASCESKACPFGLECDGQVCKKSPCQGVLCSLGYSCVQGTCQSNPMPTAPAAGGSAGSGPAAGEAGMPPGAGGPGGASGTSGTSGASGASGSAAAGGNTSTEQPDAAVTPASCACAAAGAPGHRGSGWHLLIGSVLLTWRRWRGAGRRRPV